MHGPIFVEPATQAALLALMRQRGILSYDAMIRQLIEVADGLYNAGSPDSQRGC